MSNNLKKIKIIIFLTLIASVFFYLRPDPIQFTYCREYSSYKNEDLIVKLKPLSKEEINQMRLETWRSNLVLMNNGDAPLKIEIRGHSKFGTSSRFVNIAPHKETVMDYVPVSSSYYYEGSLINNQLNCVDREDFSDYWASANL